MERTDTTYMPSAVSIATKDRVQQLAREQRRSMSQQAGELVELGIAEFERLERERRAIRAGSTQIDMEAVGATPGDGHDDTDDGTATDIATHSQ